MSNFIKKLRKITEDFTAKVAEKFGRKHFEEIKAFVIREVENHPISVELRNHTSPSKFIPGLGSHGGSLFGFMGFEENSDPVGDLISFLKNSLVRRQKFLRFFYRSKVFFPDLSDMAKEESLQLPWIKGVSWPEMIQNGVSGLKYFLSFSRGSAPIQSRSTEGLQAKKRTKNKGTVLNQVRNVDMPPLNYLDDIFERAKKIKINYKVK